MSRILVTGAAGFIGSHLVESLVKEKTHTVFAVDDLSGGFMTNVIKGSQFTKLDLRDQKKVEEYIKKVKPGILFHLAADATEGRSQFTPLSATERNYLAYMYTLIPSIKYGLKKVVLASSMSVYGSQKPPFSEEMPRLPDDIYGVSKTAMEQATEILSSVYKFDYTIIRPHNVYGKRQNLIDPYRNVISIFINCLLNNKNFYIYGDGNQKRAFTYIDDCSPYFKKAAFSNKCSGQIINIGPEKAYTINDISKMILNNFFPNGKIPQHLMPVYVASRPQEVINAYCSNDKAIKLLNYKTSITLEEGIKKVIIWAKEIGPQKFVYLKNGTELESKDFPKIWKKRTYLNV